MRERKPAKTLMNNKLSLPVLSRPIPVKADSVLPRSWILICRHRLYEIIGMTVREMEHDNTRYLLTNVITRNENNESVIFNRSELARVKASFAYPLTTQWEPTTV